MKKIFPIVLIVLLFLTDAAQAGDGLSLSISCTIPAIPGVNAPLIEEETLKTQADDSTVQSQPPVMLEEDSKEEKVTNEEQNPLAMVKTIYSR